MNKENTVENAVIPDNSLGEVYKGSVVNIGFSNQSFGEALYKGSILQRKIGTNGDIFWKKRQLEIGDKLLMISATNRLVAAISLPLISSLVYEGLVNDKIGRGTAFRITIKEKSYTLRGRDSEISKIIVLIKSHSAVSEIINGDEMLKTVPDSIFTAPPLNLPQIRESSDVNNDESMDESIITENSLLSSSSKPKAVTFASFAPTDDEIPVRCPIRLKSSKYNQEKYIYQELQEPNERQSNKESVNDFLQGEKSESQQKVGSVVDSMKLSTVEDRKMSTHYNSLPRGTTSTFEREIIPPNDFVDIDAEHELLALQAIRIAEETELKEKEQELERQRLEEEYELAQVIDNKITA